MTDNPINVGMGVIDVLAVVAVLFVWVHPAALLWLAGKCMSRRSQIIAGAKAKAEAWGAWCKAYGIEQRTANRQAHKEDRDHQDSPVSI